MDEGFFLRETPLVAEDLIGKILIVKASGRSRKHIAVRIIETESYRTTDPASHSARGWTQRSAPMFEHAGHAYVYFIYGMYDMLNFVTEPEGTPGAVLIRAVEYLEGAPKGITFDAKSMNGPGKLCRVLGITREDNRESLFGKRFLLKDDGVVAPQIAVTPRVGIREEAPFRPWRFYWDGHPCVSRAPENKKVLNYITPVKKRKN